MLIIVFSGLGSGLYFVNATCKNRQNCITENQRSLSALLECVIGLINADWKLMRDIEVCDGIWYL